MRILKKCGKKCRVNLSNWVLYYLLSFLYLITLYTIKKYHRNIKQDFKMPKLDCTKKNQPWCFLDKTILNNKDDGWGPIAWEWLHKLAIDYSDMPTKKDGRDVIFLFWNFIYGIPCIICRAHAYAIDPPVARNLLSYAIREGITKTLDVFMRCDIFSIVQDGFYAYDERGISTIEELENYTEDC